MNAGRPTREGLAWPTAFAILAIQFFIAAACVFIPAVGTEDDELLFIPPVYHPERALSTVRIGAHQFPVMLMTYVGADKTILYRHILDRLPPNVWTLRLPAALIGALTLWVLFLSIRRISEPWIATALVWIIATDSVFLLTTTFDWGPVAIQHLLVIIAFWLLARPEPRLFAGGLALGLAFWDKGIAIWTIGAFVLACLLLYWPEVRSRLNRRNLALALLGLALGAAPILRFNIRNHWATFSENTVFSLDQFSQKLLIMWRSLDGSIMFDFLVRGGAPRWASLSPWLIIAGALAMFLPGAGRFRRPGLFALISGALIWGSMLFVRSGGVSAHHAVLVWPWPHVFAILIVAAALGEGPRGKFLFALISIAVVASNIALISSYAVHAWQAGPTDTWSDAYWTLPQTYPGATRVITLDWGIQNVATYRTAGTISIEDRTFSGVTDADLADVTHTEFLRHTREKEIFHGVNEKFEAAVAARGFQIVTDQVFRDSRGNAVLEALHCSSQQR